MYENQVITGGSRRSLFDKFSYWILLVVTFLVPIFFLPVSFISLQFGTSLLFAFGVILAILIYIASGLSFGVLELPRPARYILGFSALVPFVYILAGIANGFSRMAFFGYTFDIGTVGFIVLAFIYMFLVSVLFRNKNRIFYSYFAFVISAILFALFILVRMIFGVKALSFGIFNDLATTTIGTWNNVAIFFGVGAMLSLLTHQMLRVSTFMKIVLTVALLVSLFFLAIVNFTLIWVILAISSFLFILYSLFSSQDNPGSFLQRLRKVPLYPLAVFVISIVFAIWGNSLSNSLATKLAVSSVEVRPSFPVTLQIAASTLKAQPLFGSGPNTFVTQWLQYKPDEIITSVFWNTDFTNGIGLIPTFAVTTGIIGVLSWLLFLAFYVYLGFKSIFAKIDDSFTKYLLTSSFFVSIFLWIMTFVYVPSTVIFILTFFFSGLFFASVYISGIITVSERSFGGNPRVGFLSSLVMVALFLGAILLGYGLLENSRSLWYFQKSSYALNTQNDANASENYMAKAISLVPQDVYFRSLSQIETVKLNNILNQDRNKVKVEDIQKQFNDTLTSAIKAGIASKDADPNNYLNWLSLGQVYEAVSVPQLQVNGAYESAGLAYTEALRRNPKNPGILIMFARLSANHGDLALGTSYAQQAITAKSNYLDAYFILSQIEVANKDISGAIKSVTSAAVIDPTNPAIFFQLGLLKYNVADYQGAIQALEHATTMTPDYANAKYFLGLSYEVVGEHDKAIQQFKDLSVTNPDNKDVQSILGNLLAGKPIFTNTSTSKPEKGKTLPVKEKVQ